jgi:hypothetical protein
MSTACGIEEDTWRIGTIFCGSAHIGWGVLVTIAAIVLMAMAHINAGTVCSYGYSNFNETLVNEGITNLNNLENTTIPAFDTESCKSQMFMVSVIFGVLTFVVALLFYILPGSLGVCGAQNKNTGLVCAFIVCLSIMLILEIAGIVMSFVVGGSLLLFLLKYSIIIQVWLITSIVGILLTTCAIVITGNYRTAVKQEDRLLQFMSVISTGYQHPILRFTAIADT